jgi:hypothetical protein
MPTLEDYSSFITIEFPERTIAEMIEDSKSMTEPSCLCAWYERCDICDPRPASQD